MLRATVSDEAGNTETRNPSLPSHAWTDLSWNATATDVDRLVVRPGETFGNITITGELRSNQIYAGAVVISLEAAPADRSATTDWTVMNVVTLPAGSLAMALKPLNGPTRFQTVVSTTCAFASIQPTSLMRTVRSTTITTWSSLALISQALAWFRPSLQPSQLSSVSALLLQCFNNEIEKEWQ